MNDLKTLWSDPYYRNRKSALRHVWWTAINRLGLNRPYSRLLCRLGIYQQYQPSVCGWCGKRHVKLAKSWYWAVRDSCPPDSPYVCIERSSLRASS